MCRVRRYMTGSTKRQMLLLFFQHFSHCILKLVPLKYFQGSQLVSDVQGRLRLGFLLVLVRSKGNHAQKIHGTKHF